MRTFTILRTSYKGRIKQGLDASESSAVFNHLKDRQTARFFMQMYVWHCTKCNHVLLPIRMSSRSRIVLFGTLPVIVTGNYEIVSG